MRMPLAAALLLLATGCAGPAGYPPPSAPAIYTAAEFAPIEQTVRQEIAVAHIPGAVIVIGTREGDIYRGAWGNAVLGAAQRPLTQDAIFDLASLTKPVATATAVMHLSDEGRIDIDAPAARYWPEFGANGKEVITIRELLTRLFRPARRPRPLARMAGLRYGDGDDRGPDAACPAGNALSL